MPVAVTVCTVLLYHKKKKKKTLFSKRTRFFYGYFCEICIIKMRSFCAFLQKQKNKKFFCRFCNFSCRKIVSIVKGFFAAVLPCEQEVCGSVAPLSREKGRCDGGLHCAVRGTSPERTDHRKIWSGTGKTGNIPLVSFGKNNADGRFSPMAVSAFFVFYPENQPFDLRSNADYFLIFYELFIIDSYSAVAISLESWYNERRNAEKTVLIAHDQDE